jgi:hypothetical protein
VNIGCFGYIGRALLFRSVWCKGEILYFQPRGSGIVVVYRDVGEACYRAEPRDGGYKLSGGGRGGHKSTELPRL